ncbi:hypothetical protein PHMEG_00036046 [Phytophthora megakarya]|uniref:FLZ-type domain-containing protein n=1 Tax=Phytophthora megakarya TaxID=4795 RepID=A0A225UME6_9STRA|nr:hypothetical protein PHMEG_00036046 [Phytophthora megakarya]
MIRLVFKRKQRTTEQGAKSWPTCPQPVPVPILTSQSSTTISCPNSLASSAPCSIPTVYSRPQHIRKRTVRTTCDGASWRQRQSYCANCEELFFTSLSTLSSGQDRFCSLDCKSNFEYMMHLQDAMDEEMLVTNCIGSGLFVEDEVCSARALSF